MPERYDDERYGGPRHGGPRYGAMRDGGARYAGEPRWQAPGTAPGREMSDPRGPHRAEPPRRDRYIEEPRPRGGIWRGRGDAPFRRESERDASRDYFGTGSPGVGGTGFTGGRYAFSDDRSFPGPGRNDVDLYREPYPGERSTQASRQSRPQRSYGQPQSTRRRYPPGPKGYQRSDDRLREDISERLLQSDHIDSSDVSVEVTGGKVRLEGTVPERPMKHEIEDLVDACPGVQDIENRLKVRSASAR